MRVHCDGELHSATVYSTTKDYVRIIIDGEDVVRQVKHEDVLCRLVLRKRKRIKRPRSVFSNGADTVNEMMVALCGGCPTFTCGTALQEQIEIVRELEEKVAELEAKVEVENASMRQRYNQLIMENHDMRRVCSERSASASLVEQNAIPPPSELLAEDKMQME